MVAFNRRFASSGSADIEEPDVNEVENGHGTVVPPKNTWENWWKNRLDSALQQIQRNGVLDWDSTVPYIAGAVVRYSGNYYLARTTNTNDQPNITPSSWKAISSPNSEFKTGDTMLFVMANVPVGWTKVTTHNNKALRIVSGTGGVSGGSVAFTTAFANKSVTGSVGSTTAGGSVGSTTAGGSVTVNNHTLTTSQMPAHTHEITMRGNNNDDYAFVSAGDGNPEIQKANTDSQGGGAAHNHGASFSGTSHNHSFSGTSHSHSFSGTAINLAVQHVDAIIGTKD